MKRREKIKIWSSLFLVFLCLTLELPLNAGQKMDLEAHDVVIQKLESSLKIFSKDDQNVDAVGLKLQLANLYSDKARLLLIEEGHQNCQNCLGSSPIRQKAITFYKAVRPKLLPSDKEKVTLQLAHLLETINKEKEALRLYNELIDDKSVSAPVRAQAYSKRGGSFFREGQFDKAIADFKVVLKKAPKEEHGSIHHKLAWAFFNKGEIDQAIAKLIMILKNEDLLLQKTESGFQYSESFHSEVAHDLAVFMAKDQITPSSLDRLIALSPPEDTLNNLLFLGDEAERVGQTDGAPLAWERALEMDNFPEHKKLKVILSIARFHRDRFNYKKANALYAKAIDLAQESPESLGAENKKALKQFLVLWEKQSRKLAKAQQKKGSQLALIEAYQSYHAFDSKDYETQLWLAQVALNADQPDVAQIAFHRAADLLAKADPTKNPEIRRLLDLALLEEVKMAEASTSGVKKMEAYNHYLELNPKGSHGAQVRYQKAKLLYDQNQVKEAQEQFDAIVADNSFKSPELKLKAAHLSLDALVLMKDIETLETRSIDYGRQFPKDANQFHQISRKAGLQIVGQIAKKDQSVESAEKALKKLGSVTLHGSSRQEIHTHYRMKIDLALRAQKWDLAQQALTQYLSLKDLKEADRLWALQKRLALAELLLDFTQAYKTVLQLNYLKSQNPKELLKGALLAELTKTNPTPWLEKVVQSPRSTNQQKSLARAQLVRLSPRPWRVLRQQSSYLKNRALLADLALECFDRDADFNQARWALSLPGVRSTAAGATLYRLLTLAQWQQQAQDVRRLGLNSRTDSLLTSTLKARIQALAKLKENFRHAQRADDWTLQIVAGSLLRNENQRLGVDIENLPIPKRLKPDEKKLYQSELLAQSSPFKKTALELDQFLDRTWKNNNYIDHLLEKIETSDRTRSLHMNELRSLAAFAPSSEVRRMQSQLAELKKKPSIRELMATKSQLRQDPFDLNLQNQLLSMERKLGNQTMVVFLQARGNTIKAGEL